MAAHHDSKGPDFCGPKDIRIAGRFGAAFDDALVDGPELVHVVALIGSAAGIEKRKQTGNQQRGLVMRDGVWTGKYRTCLTVKTAAVCEKYRVLRRILPGQYGALTYETLVYCL